MVVVSFLLGHGFSGGEAARLARANPALWRKPGVQGAREGFSPGLQQA